MGGDETPTRNRNRRDLRREFRTARTPSARRARQPNRRCSKR